MPLTEEVINLIRVTTAEQAEGGVERQRMANRAARARRGQKMRREIMVVDVSGRHVQNDPQFKALFKELTDPTLAGVQVAEQSRIFRPEHWADYAILDYFAKNRKLIFTPDSRIDPCTPEGRMALTFSGVMCGEELHRIRERCNGGKQKKRLEGKYAGGNHTLPRGVRFVRERDQNGRIIAERWEHDGIDSVRVMKAYELLFQNVSTEEIAREIGGGWTGKGLGDSLRNPIWKGLRSYRWKAGKETCPAPTLECPNPKPRRNSVRRDESDIVTVPIDLPPLISEEAWDRAQTILEQRRTRWRHSKKKNSTRPRFLCNGVARCSCGKPLYGQYGNSMRHHLDAYYCAGRCGNPNIKRTELDETIARIMSEKLCNASFLMKVWKTLQSAQAAAPDPGRAKREAKLAKLAKGRAALNALVRSGDMTPAEYRAEIALLDTETKEIEAMLPAPVPTLDPKELIQMLANVFASFGTLPHDEQRELLRGAFCEITLDGREIPSVTISGGYLGISAKSLPHSTTRLGIRAIPDFVIRFPQPVAIPKTYVKKSPGPAPRRKAA